MATIVRRTEFQDQLRIDALIAEESGTLDHRFGQFDVMTLIETAMLCISAVDENGEVVGFAAFHDHPSGRVGITGAEWPEWFHTCFAHLHLGPANVAWLSYFVCDPTVHAEVAENVLRSAFTTMPEVDAVLLSLPSHVNPFTPLKDTFEELTPKAGSSVPYRVSLCPRSLYLDKLRLREARVEDHDDLLPIFEAQSEVLAARYGEYFIAQLIDSQDSQNKAIAAEVDGRAVGLLALSSEIDIGTLQSSFDLDAFDGLVTADPDQLAAAATARAKADAAQMKAEAARRAVPAPVGLPIDEGEEGSEAAADEAARRDEAWRRALEVADAAAAAAAAEAAEAEACVTYTCDAVAVSMFCVEDVFESRSRDFLPGIFAAFPDKKYALLTLPHTTPEFPLLAALQQVEPRPASAFDHVLYLYHRDALLSPALKLRPADADDAAAVAALTADLVNAVEIAQMFAQAIGPVQTKLAYVAECSEQVVGVLLLDSCVDVAKVQSLYRLEDFVLLAEHEPRQHVELHTFVLNPIFAASSRFLLREVMRLHSATCIYYGIKYDTPVPDVLKEFVQLTPRPQVAVPAELTDELMASAAAAGEEPEDASPYSFASHALFLVTRKTMSEPKVVNNARIVVLGSSDASLALLEALVSVPYLHFSSLCLVAPKASQRLRAPRGTFASVADADEALEAAADSFFSRACSYTPAEVAALNLGSRVQIVEGRMLDLDRQGKAVVMTDGSLVRYDLLVVAPELGDQSLRAFGPEVTELRGAFSISDEDAAAAALEFLDERQLTGDAGAPVVVYGGSADAYCAVKALLTHGVPASDITLVVPPVAGGVVAGEPFGDEKIVSRVDDRLAALGVGVRRGLSLVGVEAGEADFRTLGAVQLASAPDAEPELMTCRMLLCCAEPHLDRPTFRALNHNSIVFDGGLIVDGRFRTNDPAIYAAGPLTKLARRLRTKGKPVAPSGRETGTKLAQALLLALDPNSSSPLGGDAPPVFSGPVSVAVDLPGGLYYYRVSKPLAGADSYSATLAHPDFGTELLTDSMSRPDAAAGLGGAVSYCSVRLDRYGAVMSIVYLGEVPADEGNWSRLIGLPAETVNRLPARFNEGLVPDIPAFLRQPCLMALYHDRFGEFRQALHAELHGDEDYLNLVHAVQASPAFLAGRPLDPAEFAHLLPDEKLELARARLRDYVQSNADQLGMYLVPSSKVMAQMREAEAQPVVTR